jgi:hypothetical protein
MSAEQQPDSDEAFEERLRKVEEIMRRKWPELRDSQIASPITLCRT